MIGEADVHDTDLQSSYNWEEKPTQIVPEFLKLHIMSEMGVQMGT